MIRRASGKKSLSANIRFRRGCVVLGVQIVRCVPPSNVSAGSMRRGKVWFPPRRRFAMSRRTRFVVAASASVFVVALGLGAISNLASPQRALAADDAQEKMEKKDI